MPVAYVSKPVIQLWDAAQVVINKLGHKVKLYGLKAASSRICTQ